MRALRFHSYGDPADVLRLERAAPPEPGPDQVRITVEACGLTPADWAICGGLHTGDFPRGIGLEASGTVDALGPGVTGVGIGDPVFGPTVYTGPSAGAADQALLSAWFRCPAGLGAAEAAALPMATETAARGLAALGDVSGRTVLISGAGTTVGFAAAQIALRHGARVIASAGKTYADVLREAGADVVAYGEGLGERVTTLVGGPVDLVFDAAPAGVMPELLTTVTAPAHIVTATDFDALKNLGVRSTGMDMHHHVLGEYAELAAQGRFTIPVAATYALEDWREPVAVSRSGQARGKLVLVP
ncbi:NADP-dependent oxidoreductase [Umezawaea tangerina]|uniref:NADPH:quinone reductase-like Zn-dependent oxidoreductase n=1 Tax=Umezawaea tangerina TaxID=84725 RepID=A0A2T0T6W3_9PSEU|nr:NADP-dependent oxidoreductase [Umezawaea tangerina]PRY41387.1 NADPH:quinone reductase-like Zn-dependent oxidoreductase [Umezawaea tangerina]